jgi:alkanesulfonate monooxygenase SsuD/methylene tetrahydromethanopterin reductase-like flavin-dependent oxidoreductase (luciferase family)
MRALGKVRGLGECSNEPRLVGIEAILAVGRDRAMPREIRMADLAAEETRPEAPALGPGSISLRVYPHELPAAALIDELCQQASLAAASGFDGVMTNEHHGGFPGYLPNPTQVAAFALASMQRGWAAPCPLLLPLKHWSHVAEDLAWLAARYPGRVGAGFAVGGLERDFELADVPWQQRATRFRAALPRVVAALRGRSDAGISADPAIAGQADHPMPLVMAAQGERAVKLAASLGLGVIYDSLQPPATIGRLSQRYRAEGGQGRRVLIRRVWLGPPPARAVSSQLAFYRSYASEKAQANWGRDELITANEPGALALLLATALRDAGADSINLRLHHQGIEPAAIREQIAAIGREVLPRLRAERSA